MTPTTQRRVAAALAVAVVVAALAVAWLVRERRDAQRPVEANTAEAARSAVGSAALKAEVRAAAEDAATKVFSYSHTSLTADKAAARELLTGEMLEQYDDAMAGVVGTSRTNRTNRTNRTVVSATVLGSALISVRGDDAKVLVFVDQRTRGTNLEKPLLDLDRVVVTLTGGSGEWKVTELDAL